VDYGSSWMSCKVQYVTTMVTDDTKAPGSIQ